MGIKVAELNTLSEGKGIRGRRGKLAMLRRY